MAVQSCQTDYQNYDIEDGGQSLLFNCSATSDYYHCGSEHTEAFQVSMHTDTSEEGNLDGS